VRDELLGIPHSDEDFLVPGVDHAGLHAALEPHGRVEDMEVHGQLVGVRFYPEDASVRTLVPSGIELTPPRIEHSTGPGHHDFEIVADGSASVEDDMRRRDFTVNAIARRLETGELVDPFGGVADLERRVLRTVAADGFREDPLRILRGLRLVSQLDFTLAPETIAQMRAEASGLRHVSGERIGGGVAVDGMGELSKLLLGSRPAVARPRARHTGARLEVIPELRPAIGYDVASPRQPSPLDEHLFAVAQATADADAELHVRLAALFHDVAKPETDGADASHATVGAATTARILRRLRYPNALRDEVVRLVAGHDFRLDGDVDAAAARRFLAAHGLEQARRLIELKRADLSVKLVEPQELDALERLGQGIESQQGSPYRLADLAVDGNDLLALGYREGPELGAALARLLDGVLDDPGANDRETLLERAEESAR
jgi:putative nucleotidyltransferase with HDIG domain